MANDRSNPPDQWFSTDLVKLDDVTYVLPPRYTGSGPGDIIVWHWCEALSRWDGAYCGNHKIVKRDPLTLSPSLACIHNNEPGPAGATCSWHIYIRDGAVVPA